MAGSYKHCTNDQGTYYGLGLLENMRDMADTVEMLYFMVRLLATEQDNIQVAEEEFYRCVRGEAPWPDFMLPGILERYPEK